MYNRYYEKIGNSEPKCIDDELPFDIPDSWEWVRIGNYALYVFSGKSPKYSKIPTAHKVIGQQANQWNGVNLRYIKYCTDDFVVDMPKSYYLQDGDVLLNTLGNGTLGRSGIFNKSICAEPILTDGHLFVFRNYNKVLSQFLLIFLQMKYDEIVKSANGSTNQTFLNLTKTLQWLVPVPPLPEQERIVTEIEKYEPLLAEYDKLEQQKSKLDGEIYDKVKKSILQYAIQGKLVPQDENNEPASELLKRIRAEKKTQLGKKYVASYIYKGDDNCYYEHIEGKDKDERQTVPFDIPDSWCWAKLKAFINVVSARRVHQSDWKSNGIPFYRAREIAKLAVYGTVDNELFISQELYENYKQSGRPQENDLMVTAVGTIGESYVVKKTDIFYYKDASVICLENRHGFNAYWLKFLMDSPYMKEQIKKYSAGTTVETITIEKANEYVIPIPPLAEQQRIVDKINEIFAKL